MRQISRINTMSSFCQRRHGRNPYLLEFAMLKTDRGLCRGRQVPPSAVCPQCRQRNVFRGAIQLKKLGDTIAHRCVASVHGFIGHRPSP